MKAKAAVLGLLMAGVAFLAVPGAAQAKTTITISGSTTVAPLVDLLARQYVKVNKRVGFKLLQGGSDIGISDVARGRVTIGMSSRTPKAGDPGGLVFNRIAKDALCIATNPRNGVENFSTQQVQNVFGGSIRNWDGVPGARENGTINVVVRTAASGTQDAFEKIFMGSTPVFPSATRRASNGLIQQTVAGDRQAVGYVSLAFQRGVKIANYQGVPCNLRNAKSGVYSGSRPLYLVTKGAARGAAKGFIDWIRNNRTALNIAASQWVPYK